MEKAELCFEASASEEGFALFVGRNLSHHLVFDHGLAIMMARPFWWVGGVSDTFFFYKKYTFQACLGLRIFGKYFH